MVPPKTGTEKLLYESMFDKKIYKSGTPVNLTSSDNNGSKILPKKRALIIIAPAQKVRDHKLFIS